MSLSLVLALEVAPAPSNDVARCTADRLRAFVEPTGVRQPWPRRDELAPALAADRAGTVLSDGGAVEDGYSQTLYVDAAARSAWVMEQGGFAGTTRVYGPLPVAGCTAAR